MQGRPLRLLTAALAWQRLQQPYFSNTSREDPSRPAAGTRGGTWQSSDRVVPPGR